MEPGVVFYREGYSSNQIERSCLVIYLSSDESNSTKLNKDESYIVHFRIYWKSAKKKKKKKEYVDFILKLHRLMVSLFKSTWSTFLLYQNVIHKFIWSFKK